jgi:predicted nuclease of restriction endonuclease-like (RecB) superfamily
LASRRVADCLRPLSITVTQRVTHSSRQLERQINSLLFERLLKSRDKEGVLELANQGQVVEKPVDAIKDPLQAGIAGRRATGH